MDRGIIPTAILMLQGHTRRMDFRTLMVGVVELAIVRSRSFDDYKEWVDSIPELTPAEKQLHEQRLRDQLLTPHGGGARSIGPGPAQGQASIRRMNRTPGLVNRGVLLSRHPIHTGVGGFVRLPGLSGPRFRARQLRAAQQPGSWHGTPSAAVATVRIVLRQSGAFARRPQQIDGRDRSLTPVEPTNQLTFTGPKETVQHTM